MSRSTTRSSGCDQFRRAGLHRRQVLCLGGLTGTGLLLADLFRARATASVARHLELGNQLILAPRR
jgi:hypothetical protein